MGLVDSLVSDECAFCGADISIIDKVYINKRGEKFCSKYHRQESNYQLKVFIKQHKTRGLRK